MYSNTGLGSHASAAYRPQINQPFTFLECRTIENSDVHSCLQELCKTIRGWKKENTGFTKINFKEGVVRPLIPPNPPKKTMIRKAI